MGFDFECGDFGCRVWGLGFRDWLGMSRPQRVAFCLRFEWAEGRELVEGMGIHAGVSVWCLLLLYRGVVISRVVWQERGDVSGVQFGWDDAGVRQQ